MSSERPSADRTLSWMPLAGAAVVAAIGVGTVIILGAGTENRLGLKTDGSGALTCPTSYVQSAVTATKNPGAWVPTTSTGVDGTKYLAPDGKPQHATICHYSATGTSLAKTANLPLRGTKVVKGGLTAMAKSLSAAPKAGASRGTCTTPGDPYILGLVFPTGALWVSIPENGCQIATNGEYSSTIDVRDQVIAAYRTGSWS